MWRMMCEFFLLNLANLFHPPRMPPALEFSCEPGAHYFCQLFKGYATPGQRQNVRVVVLAREARSLFIPGNGGAHAGNFVGGNRHARARTANKQPLIDFALG